jgi:hypothetical protein
MKKVIWTLKSENPNNRGCLVIVIALVFAAALLASCASTKTGCGDPQRWEAKQKFNK